MKKNRGIIILAIVLVCVVLLGIYGGNVASNTSAKKENSIKLGLDLNGGVSITYRIVDENPSFSDVQDTIRKLEERANNYSTEYAVYQVGTDRIAVEIPGVKDANAVLEELGSPGSLYIIKQYDKDGNANYQPDLTVEGGYKLNYEIDKLIENGSVILTGNDIKSATAQYIQDSQYGSQKPVCAFSLNDSGTKIFADATTEAQKSGHSIGIYYDDHFVSVPTVNSAITGGEGVIEGMGDFEDAKTLATFIRIGAINLKLEELDSSVVGAQLGTQALSSSLLAGAIGLALVMIFMIFMYRIPGIAAAFALGLYTSLVICFIYWFEITLTLPGIAGIILGIGMAVDANVIIFARIREEIAKDRPIASAIKEGYKKSLSAILDGNITTLIAAIVLMALGSGTVKGFAYTLMISIILSMFTALVISRLILTALYAVGFRQEKFFGRAKEHKPFDFIKRRKLCFILSLAVIAAGLIGMGAFAASGNKALNFSLEFMGGTSTSADFNQNYSIEEVESKIIPEVKKITKDNAIQATNVDNTTNIVIKTRTLSLDERQQLEDILVNQFSVKKETITSQSISSTISNEMKSDAIMAVIVSCIFMLGYIWFRFKDLRFAGSAILALLNDVLVVLTAYALIRISVGNTFIACMLTIVGYSINDTIVVFDRIRENMIGVKQQTPERLAEIANLSLTQTLTRTINTSITTIIMVLLLFIVGVASIREFALPLMIGLLSGTYTSIFIATELWYMMKLYLGKNRLIKKQRTPEKTA